MIVRTPVLVFVGPVYVDTGKPRPYQYSYHVLQGTFCLKLDYADRKTAAESRKQLLKTSHSHTVGSNKLLQAIQTAISEAKAALSQQGQDSDQ